MPWISEAALQMIRDTYEARIAEQKEENAFLRAELGTAYRHHRSIERVERKLPEREPGTPKPVDVIPENIMELVVLHPSTVQDDLLASIRAARAEQPPTTWQAIHEGILTSLPAELRVTLEAQRA